MGILFEIIAWSRLIHNCFLCRDYRGIEKSVYIAGPMILLLTSLADHFFLAVLSDNKLMYIEGTHASTLIAFVVLIIMFIIHALSAMTLFASAVLVVRSIWRFFMEPLDLSETQPRSDLLPIWNSMIVTMFYLSRTYFYPEPAIHKNLQGIVNFIRHDFIQALTSPYGWLLLLGVIAYLIFSDFEIDAGS